jgi:hypothetical protein
MIRWPFLIYYFLFKEEVIASFGAEGDYSFKLTICSLNPVKFIDYI